MGSGPRGAAQDYISGQQTQMNNTRNARQPGLDTNAQNAYNTTYASATGGPSGGASIFGPSSGTYTDLATKGVGGLSAPIAQSFGQNFNTGGFSPTDIQNMRARAVSPIAAMGANAQQGINQTRALQGGFSPNATAALAKTVRDTGYGMADASTNAEAGIAQQEQQGRQAIGQLDAQLRATGAAGLSAQEAAALQAQMGLTQFTGSEQQHNLDEQQSGNLGWGQQQLQSYQLPNGFQQVMSGIGSVLGPAAGIAGGIAGALPTSFGSSPGTANTGFTGPQGSYGNIPMSQWQNWGTPGTYAPQPNNGGVLENF